MRTHAVGLTAFGLIALGLAACGDSRPSNYYLLSAMPVPERPLSAAGSKQLAIGVGPVNLPAYLDRPQLVTRASTNRLDLAEFDRWGEPFQDMLSQTLAQNLSALLGTDFVYVLPGRHVPELDYLVSVELLRFDKDVDGKVELLARWTIMTGDEAEYLVTRKSSIVKQVSPTSSSEETIVVMSDCVEALSRDIAAGLEGLAGQMPAGSYDLRSIQQGLRAMGYDPGAADGVLGAKTREAIRRYQADHDIQVTGEPSQSMQKMLMQTP